MQPRTKATKKVRPPWLWLAAAVAFLLLLLLWFLLRRGTSTSVLLLSTATSSTTTTTTAPVSVDDRRQQAHADLNAIIAALFDDAASATQQLSPLRPCSEDPVACEREAQTMQDTLVEIQRIVMSADP